MLAGGGTSGCISVADTEREIAAARDEDEKGTARGRERDDAAAMPRTTLWNAAIRSFEQKKEREKKMAIFFVLHFLLFSFFRRTMPRAFVLFFQPKQKPVSCTALSSLNRPEKRQKRCCAPPSSRPCAEEESERRRSRRWRARSPSQSRRRRRRCRRHRRRKRRRRRRRRRRPRLLLPLLLPPPLLPPGRRGQRSCPLPRLLTRSSPRRRCQEIPRRSQSPRRTSAPPLPRSRGSLRRRRRRHLARKRQTETATNLLLLRTIPPLLLLLLRSSSRCPRRSTKRVSPYRRLSPKPSPP